jgi:hypothetical protein
MRLGRPRSEIVTAECPNTAIFWFIKEGPRSSTGYAHRLITMKFLSIRLLSFTLLAVGVIFSGLCFRKLEENGDFLLFEQNSGFHVLPNSSTGGDPVGTGKKLIKTKSVASFENMNPAQLKTLSESHTTVIESRGVNHSMLRLTPMMRAEISRCNCRHAHVLWLQKEGCGNPKQFPYCCPNVLSLKILNHSLVADREFAAAASYKLKDKSQSWLQNNSGLSLLPGSDPSCPRFILAEHIGDGLGHRISAIVFAANLADEFGFRLGAVLELWNDRMRHDDYSNVRKILGVQEALPTELELPKDAGPMQAEYRADSREEFLAEYSSRYRLQCGISVTASLAMGNSCMGQGRGCFGAWPGAFRRARRLFQRAIGAAAATAGRQQPSSACANTDGPALFREARARRELAVAWHLRCGDIVLMKDPVFYFNVRSMIATAGVPLRHFLFWKKCSEFEFLMDLLPGATVADIDIQETVTHLVGADILVHTGCSLHCPACTQDWRIMLIRRCNAVGALGVVFKTHH